MYKITIMKSTNDCFKTLLYFILKDHVMTQFIIEMSLFHKKVTDRISRSIDINDIKYNILLYSIKRYMPDYRYHMTIKHKTVRLPDNLLPNNKDLYGNISRSICILLYCLFVLIV